MSLQRRNGQQTWILTWLCPTFYIPLADSDIPTALTDKVRKRESEPWNRAQTSIIGQVGGCKMHTGVRIALTALSLVLNILHNTNAAV